MPVVHEEPASVGQRMLWLAERFRGGGGRLNYPLLLRLGGPLDADGLQRALDALVVRHEALRTTFTRRRGLLLQQVRAPGPVAVHRVEVPPDDAALDRLVAAEVATPLDPVTTSLRTTLWRLGPREHLLALNAHHLVTDAWSCRVLTDDLVALLAGTPLPPVIWQYRHWTRWQRRPSTDGRMQLDREYWTRQLDDVTAPGLSRPADGPTSGSVPRHGEVVLPLDGAAARRVRSVARAHATTPFVVLLAAFYRALEFESGRTDLAVASPFANRGRSEVQRTVGFFANLLVLRTRVPGRDRPAELLARTRDTVNEARAHQGFPHLLPPSRGDGDDRGDGGDGGEVDRRVEDVVFQMLPPLSPAARAGDLQVAVRPPELPSRFALELLVVPEGDGYRALFQYAADRIAAATVGRLAEATAQGLSGAVDWANGTS